MTMNTHTLTSAPNTATATSVSPLEQSGSPKTKLSKTEDLIQVLSQYFHVEYSDAANMIFVSDKNSPDDLMFKLTDFAWYFGADDSDSWLIANYSSTLNDGDVKHSDELISLCESGQIVSC